MLKWCRELYYSEVSKNLEQDISLELLETIRNLQGLQFYHKCHSVSDDNAIFPSHIKWQKEPKYIVGQQRVTIEYDKGKKTGEITFPTDPITLTKLADQWNTYSVKLPEEGQANQVCVFFFENDEGKK